MFIYYNMIATILTRSTFLRALAGVSHLLHNHQPLMPVMITPLIKL